MLSQYKNIEQILIAKNSISAERYTTADISDFVFDYTSIPELTTLSLDDRFEMHIYTGDTWITGNHQIQPTTNVPVIDEKNKKPFTFAGEPIAINLFDQVSALNLSAGNFRIVFNFFKNVIGSYETPCLKVTKISPDRTEVALRIVDNSNVHTGQLALFSQIQGINKNAQYTESYLLNFSRNQTSLILNKVVIGEYVYLKLYDPLPDNIEEKFKCWIVKEEKQPYVDNITIYANILENLPNILSSPNWQANYSYDTSTETGFKTWTDLLGSSVATSQQIVDSYFSGSLGGINLNINYSDFNNFIYYSLATERLENFKYKLSLLEHYQQQSSSFSVLSGSTATTNAADYILQTNRLIGGFDGFEQFLYYQSESMVSTFDIPHESPNVARITGSYIQPIPKTNTTYPYIAYSTTSSIFTNWFNTTYEYAQQYDLYNNNSLFRAIPQNLRITDDNSEMLSFVNMLGHHYDILYTYINHMTSINKREENPKLGMPNELLYSVAKQFGWNLTNGSQNHELWQYVKGTSEAGVPLTGSNSVGEPSVPGRELTYSIWRRIVNNLPLLLKSKGTKRSVQALLSCYGIPQSIISINEYGGPSLNKAPIYEKLNFDYSLDLIGNTAGTVQVNFTQSINTVELRFRTDNVITNPTMPSTMNLFTIGSNTVTLDYTSGTKGTMKINGTGSANIELFDGGWLTTMLRTNGNKLDLITKKSKYGKIVAAVSASATASFNASSSLTLGGTSAGASRLKGQLQELRFWTSSLLDIAFNNHVKAPAAYNANSDPYNELIFRLPLTQKINHTLTSSLNGVEPKASNISALFSGWSTSTPYDSIEETYYYDAISLGSQTSADNKIRLEDNSLTGQLDIKTRAERSEFDKAPLDNNKLGIYFSPQTMINEDIISHYGYTILDDLIGDTTNTDTKSYPKLIQAANLYWKKYLEKNDINAYIKIFTLFDLSFFNQLDQLLPARVNKITGVLIQPNLLERNVDTILPKVAKFNDSYDALITQTTISASSDYLQLEGSTTALTTISSDADNQLIAYFTASSAKKYAGTTYAYNYLIYSGSTYITASSAYWLSEAILPVYLTSTYSEFKLSNDTIYLTSSYAIGIYGSGSYASSSYAFLTKRFTGSLVQIQDYLPIGVNNQRYNGSKMTSPAFNVNSTQTVDGKPVVEWSTSNPNQLIYQSDGNQGSLVLV